MKGQEGVCVFARRICAMVSVGHVVCMSVWVKGEVRGWVRLVIQCAAWERFCVEMCIEVLGNE